MLPGPRPLDSATPPGLAAVRSAHLTTGVPMLMPYLAARGRIHNGRTAVFLAWLLPLLALAPPGFAAASGLEVLSTTDEMVVLVYRGEPTGAARGDDGALLIADRLQPDGPVAPFVSAPAASAWIALPPGGGATVSARVYDDALLSWPASMTAAERARVIAALPPSGAIVGEACWVHNQWGVPVSFRPVSVAATGELRCVREARITVSLRDSARKLLPSRLASGDDAFEGIYRGLFANYPQGRSWRRAAPAAERARQSDGFNSTPNPWVKIRVSRRGPQVVSGEDLRALGLSLTGAAAVDPVTLRLFRPRPGPLREDENWRQAPAWMVEVPIEVRGGGDGTLDPQDTIVFLGQGPDGWYDELGAPTSGPDRFYREPYDSDVVYWLTWGGTFEGTPRRILTVVPEAPSQPFVTIVNDRAHFELDKFWEPRQRESTIEPAEQNPSWERFWWLSLDATAPAAGSTDEPEKVIRVAPLDPVPERPVRLRVRLWGNSSQAGSLWPDHAARVKLNGALVALTDRLPGGRPWNAFLRRDVDTTGTWLRSGDQELRFSLPYHPFQYPDSTRRDNVLLAWIEMDYSRRLVAHGDTLAFQTGSLLKSVQSFSLTGFATADLTVWDATDPFSPVRIQPVASDSAGTVTLRFRAEAGGDPSRRFLAWSNAKLVRPRLEIDAPPAGGYLRARTDPERMIVITHGDFREQAEALAAYRRTHFPASPGQPAPASVPVAVVDVQDVYDEFSFGRVDPTAIRNFLQFTRESWDGGDPGAGPAYVFLLGDAQYDFRNTLGRGARVFVPTYEGNYDPGLVNSLYSPQFGSDDYFAYLDGPGDTGLDLYIGRGPVQTRFEAETVVQKVQDHETAAAKGPWDGRITLVADDICQGTNPDDLGFLHMRQTEALVPLLPKVLQIDKVFLYEYGTECAYTTKPLAAAALRTRMNEGTLLVNFTGHGSDQQLADERVFETSGVSGLTNADRLFLFFTASCSVGKYDYFGQGLGEAMLLRRGGGAIAVFSASAIAYSGGNAEMNQKFFQAIFPGQSAYNSRPMGEATVRAKLTLGLPGNINSKRYILLADPAVRLAVPDQPIDLVLEAAHGDSALGGSLRRGVLTDLRLTVRRPDSTVDAAFEGTAQVRVYDSSPVRPMGTNPQTYLLTGAPIFRGEAEMHQGVGALRFQVPGALRTGLRGPAGLFAYAAAGDRDALGALPELSVPESEAPAGTDHEGPRIQVHFDGDSTALAPGAFFTADLFDSSGVNITGLVPSRSVVMQVEENGTLVVAEDLASEVVFGNDFRSARLEHHLPSELEAGRAYELVLRASDNVSNSGSVRVPFTIAGGTGGVFTLDEVYNFPNPTGGGTGFFGRLSGSADLVITLYTISGKRIWRAREAGVTPVQLAREGISWDGRDADGDVPANGVYLYRIEARPLGGGQAREVTGRLVVSR
jgi:hypothetical protein